jgi:hypothetical protein
VGYCKNSALATIFHVKAGYNLGQNLIFIHCSISEEEIVCHPVSLVASGIGFDVPHIHLSAGKVMLLANVIYQH